MAIKSRARQANKLITQETATLMGIDKSEVLAIIDFYTGFTAETIKAGLFKGVSFPHFGKIIPKVKQITYRAARKGWPEVETNIYTEQEHG